MFSGKKLARAGDDLEQAYCSSSKVVCALQGWALRPHGPKPVAAGQNEKRTP